jgi:hypothetical protein
MTLKIETCKYYEQSTEGNLYFSWGCECSWCTTLASPKFDNYLRNKAQEVNKLKEENEKLKGELEAAEKHIKIIKETYCVGLTPKQILEKFQQKIQLEKENERLKAEIEQLTGISGQLKILSVDDAVKLNQIICPRIKELEAQLERANKFYKDLTAENVQLKVDNESLKDYAERRDQTIIALGKRSKAFDEEIAQLKAENKKLHDFVERNYTTFCYENMHSELMTLRNVSEYNCREVEKLSKENAQLKVQLQNCDKALQDAFNNHNMMPEHAVETERKPHKCPRCDGHGKIEYTTLRLFELPPMTHYYAATVDCHSCNSTGIV